MSLKDGFFRFLNIIGIGVEQDPAEGSPEVPRADRTGYSGRNPGEHDFEDDNYSQPRTGRYGGYDTYKGVSRMETDGADMPEPDNMVEFKNIRQQSAPVTGERMHTVIYYLRGINDCKDIINDLLEDRQVILNIEDTDRNVAHRAVDMLSGAAYALGADIKRASTTTYLIAPHNVVVNDSKEEEEPRNATNSYASNVRNFRS